jgi:biopolymer transport protein ExbD
MILGKKRKRGSTEIPMASLPDIVFLLLIFFLVTTAIDAEKGLDLVLPEMNVETKVPPENIAKLLINPSGQVSIDLEPIEIPDITRVVKEKIMDNPNLIISIKTARQTKYEVYIDVLDRLKKAEAKKISIAEPDEL